MSSARKLALLEKRFFATNQILDMSRSAAKLVAFDPRRQKSLEHEPASLSPPDYSYQEWTFYETDSFMISWEAVAKAAYNKSMKTKFVYIAKKIKNNGTSVVKGSAWEMSKLLSFLTHALDQLHQHPMDGKSFESLIPLLDKDEHARVPMTKDNKLSFFDRAQVKSQNLSCRLIFSEITGEYVCYLRTPVPMDIQHRLKWCGPCFQLNPEDMARLETFLKHTLHGEPEDAN